MISSIQEEALRFGDLVIKSDKDVANFRNRIYTKIKKVIIFNYLTQLIKGIFFFRHKKRRCAEAQLEDLPEILKELKTKALANLGSRQNRKTPFNKLKRNLEGLFIQMKNVSIFISTQAGDFTENILTYNFPQLIVKLQLESCKTRTKFRGVLTKLKGKAVKLLSLINSKYRAIHGIISMDDFEKGIFPWDVNSEDDSENESSTCKFFIFFLH